MKETGTLSQLVAHLSEGVAWYDVEPKLKPKIKHKHGSEPLKATDELVVTLKQHAQELLQTEVARFETQKSGKLSSDDKYLATMIKSGTLSDRVAALTLTVQASPLHALLRLGQLITMANKKARRESLMAIDSLKDLFLNNLLPNEAKLRFFHQHPLHDAQSSSGHLVLWLFEHCLKNAYRQLTEVLASGMDDAVDSHKRACLRAANALLKAKPEQEALLLAMVVNKLGDPDRKFAAYVHCMLQEVLREHPAMKRVVVDEVERLLTRPKVSDRATYHAILFLNQLYLEHSGEDANLASHLIAVYFGLFSKKVQRQKEQKAPEKTPKKFAGPILTEAMDRKLLSALLVGVNRAFPYANPTTVNFKKEIQALFQVVHRAPHSTSVQALMLLFQVMNSTNSVSDRFYSALYGKLLDPKVHETSKHTLFLNLIYRAMKADVSPARGGAFMKRLLQVASGMPPAFACAVLFLLSELLKVKPHLRTLVEQPESGTASGTLRDEEQFNDVESLEEVAGQNASDEENATSEATPVEEENDRVVETETSAKVLAKLFGTDQPSSGANVVQSSTRMEHNGYDPSKRNPLFAGASLACAWELHLFSHHYHPSVQSFTRQLVDKTATGIQYAGDPLVDFTLHAFFEKFVNKKPRHKGEGTKGWQRAKAKNWTFVPLNTEAVLQAKEEEVEASDHFFYKFYKERATRATRPVKAKTKRLADASFDDICDDGDDEEMEGFAQELAEGMMKEGDYDDEDPDMTGWSDSDKEEDEDDEGWLANQDDEERGETREDQGDGVGVKADEEDRVLQEELREVDERRKRQGPPKARAKRKGVFASADDYDTIVKEATRKQTTELTRKTKKGRRA